MKDIVIFDLDGTLADGRHRLHLLPTVDPHLPRSWDKFNLAAGFDLPIQDNIELCNILGIEYKIVILTGRNEVVKETTKQWLQDNGVKYDMLIMRAYDDDRKDVVIKEEVVRELGIENILCAFDDLPHVARHFRSLGITTHLVTEYEDTTRTDLQPHGADK